MMTAWTTIEYLCFVRSLQMILDRGDSYLELWVMREAAQWTLFDKSRYTAPLFMLLGACPALMEYSAKRTVEATLSCLLRLRTQIIGVDFRSTKFVIRRSLHD